MSFVIISFLSSINFISGPGPKSMTIKPTHIVSQIFNFSSVGLSCCLCDDKLSAWITISNVGGRPQGVAGQGVKGGREEEPRLVISFQSIVSLCVRFVTIASIDVSYFLRFIHNHAFGFSPSPALMQQVFQICLPPGRCPGAWRFPV